MLSTICRSTVPPRGLGARDERAEARDEPTREVCSHVRRTSPRTEWSDTGCNHMRRTSPLTGVGRIRRCAPNAVDNLQVYSPAPRARSEGRAGGGEGRADRTGCNHVRRTSPRTEWSDTGCSHVRRTSPRTEWSNAGKLPGVVGAVDVDEAARVGVGKTRKRRDDAGG